MLFASVPVESTLARSVIAVARSWTKTSVVLFESPATRFEASLWNATTCPSTEIDGHRLSRFPSAPEESTLTRSVIPVARSWTKTSNHPFVSPATRFEAPLPNATTCPSAEIEGGQLSEFASAPDESTLIRSVIPVTRSWTKMSDNPFVSPKTRFEAQLSKVTTCPSAEIDG